MPLVFACDNLIEYLRISKMKNLFLVLSIIILLSSGLLFFYTYSQLNSGQLNWSNSLLNKTTAEISNRNFEKIYLQHNVTGRIESIKSLSASDNSYELTIIDEFDFPNRITAQVSSAFPSSLYLNNESSPELVPYSEFFNRLEIGGKITVEAFEDLMNNTTYINTAFISE